MSQIVIADLDDNRALTPAARRTICGGYQVDKHRGVPPPSGPVPIPYPNTELATGAWQPEGSSLFALL